MPTLILPPRYTTDSNAMWNAAIEAGKWSASDEEIHEALRFAGKALGDEHLPLPPAVVMDVGKITGRGWAIIEANAAWGSGIYGCEASQVLRVIQRACKPRDRLPPADRAWLVERGRP